MKWLTRMTFARAVWVSLATLALVGFLDFVTPKLSFALFYLLPIAIATWYGSKKLGLVLVFCSGGLWAALYLDDYGYRGIANLCWETGIPLGFFLAFSLTLSSLKNARKRLEAAVEKLSNASAELARSNQDLEHFAYIASHDLQEPLRMVTSYLQLLQMNYKSCLDEKAHEFMRFAVDGAVRMRQLIDDLLTYARVGTRAKEFEPVDCGKLLEEVENSLAVAIEESQATLTHNSLPTVAADKTQLGQLLQNLIGNAIKFRGGNKPHVHVAAHLAKGQWEFSVKDNGIGIDPQFFGRIFEIFQRLHDRSCYSGTGIGLAVCKKIVERHGGRIWVESQPGAGSTFHFTIPQAKAVGSKAT